MAAVCKTLPIAPLATPRRRVVVGSASVWDCQIAATRCRQVGSGCVGVAGCAVAAHGRSLAVRWPGHVDSLVAAEPDRPAVQAEDSRTDAGEPHKLFLRKRAVPGGSRAVVEPDKRVLRKRAVPGGFRAVVERDKQVLRKRTVPGGSWASEEPDKWV